MNLYHVLIFNQQIFRIVRAEVNPFIVHCIASPDKYWRRLERALGVKVKQDQLYEKVEIEGNLLNAPPSHIPPYIQQ